MKAFLAPEPGARHALVVVFLRGAADGLTLVPPVEDDDSHRARPTLAVRGRDALPLDGFFGLHPALGPLQPLFREGVLSIHHAVGSEDDTRSHFAAQDLMERAGDGAGGGWLARHLRHRRGEPGGPLAAIAIGEALPESLRGAPGATALRSLEAISFGEQGPAFASALEALHAPDQGLLGATARQTLAALRQLDDLARQPAAPAPGADYPDHRFGQGLALLARLIKARVGLEAATIDLDGWDTHFTQAPLIVPLMDTLARGIAAFRADLGTDIEHVSVVVMTEFGRRVAENSAIGTDHGRASVFLALGGGIAGGAVRGRWPGLSSSMLEGPGDLAVTTNYRDLLAGVIAPRWGAEHLSLVFPGFPLRPASFSA